ncbi:CpsB/CapC family capsule biosynthesis tyrosine phosphatase [Flavobacterium sp. SUN052]|uniref:tyrosine-protein phosphatase n=1 Tax=Flavobacterium sp. SUN052 TaxID=3002441 RepID=UPI00237DB798|nr:CpsB/CapC family capsule biosynthesis tyrosine phosphatase [Flavobacterium sp. SUN052]MEC4004408.1 CpsB/CapC family capsule biosynthesis tyrosine phosphatase [Flavobacterium sp. SUN052]
MFFFKKNKPLLSDLIPSDYVDIHSHLLPNIDDGSKSIDDTIHLVTELKKIGFAEFVTTPHVINQVWENTSSIIEDKLKNTIVELNKSGIQNSFKAAAEYMLDDNFRKLFQTEKLLTIKDNYVLVEMSYINAPMQLYEIIFELQIAGYKPILAHPERYNFYHSAFDEYIKLKKMGCLFQLNLLSSVGYYGPNVAKVADDLLKNNLIDFVGSDVHHGKHIDFFYKKIVLKNLDSLKEAIQNNSLFKS